MTQPKWHNERYELPAESATGAGLVRMQPTAIPVHARIETVSIGSGAYTNKAVIYAKNLVRTDLVDRFFTIVATEQDITVSPSGEPNYVGSLDLQGYSLHVWEVFPIH